MAEHQSTHEVAEQTRKADEGKAAEARVVKRESGGTTEPSGVLVDREAEQVQPDGR